MTIEELKQTISEMEKNGEDMTSASWGYEEGILISGNDAKNIVVSWGALKKLLESIYDELNCPSENESHYCPNCDNTIDRNDVLRKQIKAIIFPSREKPEQEEKP